MSHFDATYSLVGDQDVTRHWTRRGNSRSRQKRTLGNTEGTLGADTGDWTTRGALSGTTGVSSTEITSVQGGVDVGGSEAVPTTLLGRP